jgi:hypothetical protein
MADDQKRLAVVVGDDLRELTIRPGTTCADVLAELGVGGDYWLARRDGQPLGADENVWACANGEKLVATPPIDVSVTLQIVPPNHGDATGVFPTHPHVVVARLRSCGKAILGQGLRRWMRGSWESVARLLTTKRNRVATRSKNSLAQLINKDLQRWMSAGHAADLRAFPKTRNKLGKRNTQRKRHQRLKRRAVTRNTRPFELERNWTPGKDGILSGYYKTRGKRPFKGAIDMAHDTPEFYICDQAGHIKDGEHGACLQECNRGRGWYRIHYSPPPTSVASGIIAVEEVIRETTI